MSQAVRGIDFQRAFEILDAVPQALLSSPVPAVAALEVEPVSGGILGGSLHQWAFATLDHVHLQAADDGTGDLLLDREHVLQVAVVRFRPDGTTAADVDQLRGDAKLLAFPAHAALQCGFHPQTPADLANVVILPFQLSRGTPGSGAQAFHLGERVDQFDRHAVAEVLLVPVRALVRKRQDGDRFLFRGRAAGGPRRPDRHGYRLQAAERRAVASAHEFDDDWILEAVGFVMMVQLGAKPPGLDAHDRVEARIKGLVLVEDSQSNQVFLELIGVSIERLVDYEGEEPAQPSRVNQGRTLEDLFELRADGLRRDAGGEAGTRGARAFRPVAVTRCRHLPSPQSAGPGRRRGRLQVSVSSVSLHPNRTAPISAGGYSHRGRSRRCGHAQGAGLSEKVVWQLLQPYATAAEVPGIAPPRSEA